MEFSISLNVNDRITETVTKSQEAECLGLDYVWVPDLPSQRYAPVVASAAASMTSKIRIGVGLISPFLHTPQQIASSLITLIESYGNRFDLCIGPGDKEELHRVGVDLEGIGNIPVKLIQARNEIREYLRKRNLECKIWLGAQGPRLLKIASSFEGVLLNYASEEMIEWAIKRIRDSSKEMTALVGVFAPSYIYRNINQEIVKVLQYASLMVALGTSDAVLREFSLLEPLEPAKRELRLKSFHSTILKRIPPRLMERFSIFKRQDELPEYLNRMEQIGIDHIVFSYPQAYSIETLKELSEALNLKKELN